MGEGEPFREDDFLPRFVQDIPRTTPLFLQQLENLHQLTTVGTRLPMSTVEGRLFGRLDELSPGVEYPLVDRPCPPVVVGTGPFVVGQALETCVATIEGPSALDLADPDTGEVFTLDHLDDDELADARWFVEHNPLDHLVGSIEVPDVAASLGPRLVTGQLMIQRRLPASELPYDGHDEWVDAFADATRVLVRARLWDRDLGRRYVAAADQSRTLR